MKKLILSLLDIDVQKEKTACLGITSKMDENHFAFGAVSSPRGLAQRWGKILAEAQSMNTPYQIEEIVDR